MKPTDLSVGAVTCLFVWMFRKHCMPYERVIENKKDDTVQTYKRMELLHDSDTGNWALGFMITYLGCLGICLAIMLVP